jgi:hypothetical protein
MAKRPWPFSEIGFALRDGGFVVGRRERAAHLLPVLHMGMIGVFPQELARVGVEALDLAVDGTVEEDLPVPGDRDLVRAALVHPERLWAVGLDVLPERAARSGVHADQDVVGVAVVRDLAEVLGALPRPRPSRA